VKREELVDVSGGGEETPPGIRVAPDVDRAGPDPRTDAERAWLAAIVDSSDDAIIGKTLDGIISSWNAGAERLYGFSATEAIGRPISMIVPGAKLGELATIMERIAHGERIDHYETTRARKDGGLVEVAVTISPIKDGSGGIVGASSVARDITERRNVERVRSLNEELERLVADRTAELERAAGELTQSEARMRAVVASAPDAVVTIDHRGTISEFNPAAEAMFGYARDEMVGRSLADTIIPPSLRSHHREGLARYLRTGEQRVIGRRVELRAMRADGSEFPVEVSIERIGLPGPPAFTGFIRDITRRKEAERDRERLLSDVQQLNDDLERRVAERTAQLQDAVDELESFSYSVSHDLRAPLRAIDGFSRILLRELGPDLAEEPRARLAAVREGAQRMGALIDDLLTFSRLGREPVDKQPVDLVEVVEACLEELEPVRDQRTVDITVGDLPPCMGDASLLRHVFGNLLENALKFTARNPQAHIEVGYEAGTFPPIYFVRDDGAGFDMRYADKLFGVFQRLHLADEFDGTGVGLAIVQRIVHRHGGRVWAAAEVGKGATFSLTLAGGVADV
jgi:PAS domain S-box-containing protein